MKRLRQPGKLRKLARAITGLSLLLGLTAAVLGAVSYRRNSMTSLMCRRDDGCKVIGLRLETVHGYIAPVLYRREVIVTPETREAYRSEFPQRVWAIELSPPRSRPPDFSGMAGAQGVYLAHSDMALMINIDGQTRPVGHQLEAGVAIHFGHLAWLSLLPVLLLRGAWMRVRPPHACECGYDLRATADAAGPLLERCPECGKVHRAA